MSNYFYPISRHSDPDTAATLFSARFEPFRVNSSQVPLHEAFTHKIGVFQSCPVVPNRAKLSLIVLFL